MSDSSDLNLGEWEFVGRRGGERARLVPGEVIAASSSAKSLAEQASKELRFDFLDDRAVLRMLRLRHEDEVAMFNAGLKIGVPLAIIGFGAAVYWGGVVQYWGSNTARTGYAAGAIVVVVVLAAIYVRTAVAHWGDPVRQNLRARARKYRELAHLARREGADVPARYPHYGPYPFAANFHPQVDEAQFNDRKGHS
ncbi:hypothetical protein [Streptomyces gilvus]|uniref:hypothetical protein n=1 Tax=Streptomyces gilvus TaxID=2920937 RepID=UPI001F1005BE|nr:hypothetical protein [Streptomyces sp. CME 23]MCH5676635.1 hypothetical protein [Streptomyces sp. CME 23]